MPKIRGGRFIVTCQERRTDSPHKRTKRGDKVFYINGREAPKILLKNGRTYIFQISTRELGKFYFTEDIVGGGTPLSLPVGRPIGALPSSDKGEIVFVADRNVLPERFFYQSNAYPFRGGEINIIDA